MFPGDMVVLRAGVLLILGVVAFYTFVATNSYWTLIFSGGVLIYAIGHMAYILYGYFHREKL